MEQQWSTAKNQGAASILPVATGLSDLCPRPVDCDYVNRMVLRKTHGETSERTYQEAERWKRKRAL